MKEYTGVIVMKVKAWDQPEAMTKVLECMKDDFCGTSSFFVGEYSDIINKIDLVEG